MDQQRLRLRTQPPPREPDDDDSGADEREIRYSLTALGEAAVTRRVRRYPQFAGFGPCMCPARDAS